MSYMYNEVSVAKVILLHVFYFTLLEELGGQHFLGIFVDNAQSPYSLVFPPHLSYWRKCVQAD